MRRKLNDDHLDEYFFGVVSDRCDNIDGATNPEDLTDSFGITAQETLVLHDDTIVDEEYENPIKDQQVIVMQYEITRDTGCKLYFFKQWNLYDPVYVIQLPQMKEITDWYPVFSLYDNYLQLIPYV